MQASVPYHKHWNCIINIWKCMLWNKGFCKIDTVQGTSKIISMILCTLIINLFHLFLISVYRIWYGWPVLWKNKKYPMLQMKNAIYGGILQWNLVARKQGARNTYLPEHRISDTVKVYRTFICQVVENIKCSYCFWSSLLVAKYKINPLMKLAGYKFTFQSLVMKLRGWKKFCFSAFIFIHSAFHHFIQRKEMEYYDGLLHSGPQIMKLSPKKCSPGAVVIIIIIYTTGEDHPALLSF